MGSAESRSRADEEPIEIATLKREDPVDFTKEILPVLRKNCLACHSQSKSKGDLVLETPETIRKGGAEGPAVVAGKGMESLLLVAAAHTDELYMPPKRNKVGARNLTPRELGLIKLWIDQGAKGSAARQDLVEKWHRLPAGRSPVRAVAVTEDGSRAACSRANRVFVYDLQRGGLSARLTDLAVVERGVYASGEVGIAHLDEVQALAFHPRGDVLASAGFRTVKLWRRQPSRVRLRLPSSGVPVLCVAVGADGRRLAAGGEDGKIRLWNLVPGAQPGEPRVLEGGGALRSLCFSADGRVLVSGSLDKTLRVWDGADGRLVRTIETPAAVHSVCFSGAADVAVGGADGVVRLLALEVQAAGDKKAAGGKAAEGEAAPAPRELKGHGGPVNGLCAVGASGARLLSGSEDGTVKLWDVAQAKELRSMKHGEPVTAVAASPDGKLLASAGGGRTTKIWNAADGKPLFETKGEAKSIREHERLERRAKIFASRVQAAKGELDGAQKDLAKKDEAVKKAGEAIDGAKKAIVEKEAALKKAESAEKPDKKAIDKARKEVEGAKGNLEKAQRTRNDAELDGKRATERVTSRKKVLEVEEGDHQKRQAELQDAAKRRGDAEGPIRAVAFTADGSSILSAGDRGLLESWHVPSGAPREAFGAHEGGILAVDVTSRGDWISAGRDGSIVVWEPGPRWVLEKTLGDVDDSSIFSDRVLALDFSPDGTLLATGGGEPSRQGELKIWKLEDGSLVRDLGGVHSDSLFAVEFSPCGRYLASAGADRFVRVVRLEDGKLLGSYEGHTHHVLGVSWKADGKTLASCGADKVVKVWNVETREPRRTIGGFGKQITDLEFVGDSDNVLTSCADSSVRLHQSGSGKQVRSFGGSSDFVYAVAATPAGDTVVAGGYDGVLRVWDGKKGPERMKFESPPPLREF